eukprot:3437250-Rhodomonas_salina.1
MDTGTLQTALDSGGEIPQPAPVPVPVPGLPAQVPFQFGQGVTRLVDASIADDVVDIGNSHVRSTTRLVAHALRSLRLAIAMSVTHGLCRDSCAAHDSLQRLLTNGDSALCGLPLLRRGRALE